MSSIDASIRGFLLRFDFLRLLIGGPIRITRYHRDPENTKKSIDDEGYFHTGDVAAIDNAGRLKIVDRIKNVMKLSQGFVNPQYQVWLVMVLTRFRLR